MDTISRYLIKLVDEIGLFPVYNASMDTKILFLQRFVRLFAYGGSTLILVAYLSALENSDEKIGTFMTLTLIGDVLISFCLTLVADNLGRKAILAMGAVLMTMSGVIFAMSGNYWVLLFAAIVGIISPNGNEIGPFRAIEESTLAHLSPPDIRPIIYAWYALVGSVGVAFGLMTCGWTTRYLTSLDGWDHLHAYRAMFFAYAALGLIKLALALSLSTKVEVEKVEEPPRSDPETAPLLGNDVPDADFKKPNNRLFALLPTVTAESRVIATNLCLLFMLDALGSGLVPYTWVIAFFERKFHLQKGTLGSLFFTTSIIAAISSLIAASIAKRIGNIKTMVFTHLPSTIALALIPVPNNIHFAALFLILRSCTQSMDVAPRSAFLAAVVLPSERTAVMGLINVVKTSSASAGPTITGVLVARNIFWVSFVAAGVLKATYDLGVLAVFAGHVSREDKAEAAAAEARAEAELAHGNGDGQPNGGNVERTERVA